jgi:hypothetical protein
MRDYVRSDFRLLINGRLVQGAGALDVINPATGRALTAAPRQEKGSGPVLTPFRVHFCPSLLETLVRQKHKVSKGWDLWLRKRYCG